MTDERRRGVRFVDADGETRYLEMNPLEHPHYVLRQSANVRAAYRDWSFRTVAYRREWWFIPEGPLVNPVPYPWVSRCPKLIAPSIYDVSMVTEPCQRQFGHAGPCSTTYDRYIDVVYREEP